MIRNLRQTNLVEQLENRRVNGYIIYNRNPSWWGRWLGDYGHCYVILRQANQWVEIHHHFSYTNVTVYPKGAKWTETIGDAITQQFVVDIPYRQQRIRHLFQPFTCVETCKSLLGIKKWWIVTPYQLYRFINGQQTKSIPT